MFGVHLLQRPGDAVGHRAGLAGHAAADDVGRHVDLLPQLDREERSVGLLGEVLVGEVAVEGATVDGEFAGTLR
jgi:hypothetical protein